MGKNKQIRPRLTSSEYDMLMRMRSSKKNNVLVIGDIHAPFTKKGYLQHCEKIYKENNCNKVIFIGDVIDAHASNYHESDPDGRSAGDELDEAVKVLSYWHKAFPGATVVLGNHDLIAKRKAFSGGVSRRWIKDFTEVLETPSWEYVDQVILDNVLYVHGTGTSGANAAYKRMMERGISTVIGHVHTESSIKYSATYDALRFAMMVGCGVDETAYSMEYGRNFPRKMIVSCATVLDGIPQLHPMRL